MPQGYASVTVTFEEVREPVARRGNCPVCGRAVKRSTTFVNTISPYNKAADGHVRTREEIRAHLRELADDWTPDFTHEKCRG